MPSPTLVMSTLLQELWIEALMDRFTIVEMDVLTDEEELGLLTYMFPHVDPDLLERFRDCHTTRMESKSDNGKVSTVFLRELQLRWLV